MPVAHGIKDNEEVINRRFSGQQRSLRRPRDVNVAYWVSFDPPRSQDGGMTARSVFRLRVSPVSDSFILA
jgi:hypothetical protein